MAIDTKAKRFSMLHAATVQWALHIDPDGTIAQGDRQHLLHLYSGIAAGAPAGGVPLFDIERLALHPLDGLAGVGG